MFQHENANWDHRKVYDALVARGEKVKKSPTNQYVCLYRQDTLCALLYAPTSGATYRTAPLHINAQRPSFNGEVWLAIRASLAPQPKHVDNKGPGKESHNFAHYEVLDWARFAEGLGLTR